MAWLAPALAAGDAEPDRAAEASHMRTLLLTAVKRVLEASARAVVAGKVVAAPEGKPLPPSADLPGVAALAGQLADLIPDMQVDLQACVDLLGADDPAWTASP